jgi:hypothetical protein
VHDFLEAYLRVETKRIGNCKEGIATLLTNENLPKD